MAQLTCPQCGTTFEAQAARDHVRSAGGGVLSEPRLRLPHRVHAAGSGRRYASAPDETAPQRTGGDPTCPSDPAGAIPGSLARRPIDGSARRPVRSGGDGPSPASPARGSSAADRAWTRLLDPRGVVVGNGEVADPGSALAGPGCSLARRRADRFVAVPRPPSGGQRGGGTRRARIAFGAREAAAISSRGRVCGP